jgi:hypothetical protein
MTREVCYWRSLLIGGMLMQGDLFCKHGKKIDLSNHGRMSNDITCQIMFTTHTSKKVNILWRWFGNALVKNSNWQMAEAKLDVDCDVYLGCCLEVDSTTHLFVIGSSVFITMNVSNLRRWTLLPSRWFAYTLATIHNGKWWGKTMCEL